MQVASRFIPTLVSFLMRTLALTLRFRIEDRCGFTRPELKTPVIGIFWHNRLLVVPLIYGRFCAGRRGHCLTSPSKDGAIIAGVMKRFGIGNVRGSSSRRGSMAMLELASVIEAGGDVAITPDGPRGPKYRLHPGPVKLAQVTGAPVMPIHIGYSRYWEIKSWDSFRIPKPFARVTVVFGEFQVICPTTDDEAFETARTRLEAEMIAGMRAVDTASAA